MISPAVKEKMPVLAGGPEDIDSCIRMQYNLIFKDKSSDALFYKLFIKSNKRQQIFTFYFLFLISPSINEWTELLSRLRGLQNGRLWHMLLQCTC